MNVVRHSGTVGFCMETATILLQFQYIVLNVTPRGKM